MSRDTEVVQQFNAELSSLYEVRPPISKAKMSQITKVSMKAIKMYKHIVQSVERFIIKCRPEYKIPGLYVIDSIVRQSRHQFGADKDVYAPRFARNFAQTFQNLFLTCPPDDKPKIVRVLNLWQRNNVFNAETIQPLLDMANPNASLSQMKFDSSPQSSTNVRDANREARDGNLNIKDPNLIMQLQQLATSLGLTKSGNTSSDTQQESQSNPIKFNKKLLDFDYGDDEEEEERGDTPTEAEPPIRSNSEDNNVTNPLAISMAQNLLSNPELLQQLQQMQKTIQQTELLKLSISELEGQSSNSSQQFLSALQQQSQQNQTLINSDNNNTDESRKQNDLNMNFESVDQKQNNNDSNQLNPNLNANDNSFQYLHNANNFGPQMRANELNYNLNNSIIDTQQYIHQTGQPYNQQMPQQDINERSGSQSPRMRSPRRSRFNRYRDRSDRSRSRSPRSSRRDRDRDGRRSYRSRSRSPRNSRFNDRVRSPQSYERERERERRRKGLPPIRKGCLTICSTTLWLGHVPKLVSEADLSDTFGEFGAINSIDLIPSRGCAYVCMNRRQDAAKALSSLKSLKLHGSLIKMAWAPGKGMKGKEYKDYWEVDEGASYIPYNKLPENVDLDLLEEGGTVDEDTVPEKLQEIRIRKNKEREDQERETAALMARAAAMMQPMPMVGIPNHAFGVPGLVMPTSIMNITSQTPVIPIQSEASMITTAVTTTTFPQIPPPPMPPMLNSDDKNEITEVMMKTETSHSSDNKSDVNITANITASNTPLFPPPFQAVPPLSIPPMPMLGNQPRLPWISGPPPPILPNRMQVSPQRPPLLSLSSVVTSTTDTIITSLRPEDISRSSLPKPEDRPPLISTLPNLPITHDELQRLHSDRQMDRMDRNFNPRDRFRSNIERPDLERSHSHTSDDPFAPSVYELRAMERNQMLRPPIPHQMASGRAGLLQMPPQLMNDRFPYERPQRPYHPRHMRPDIRHHNYDRHTNQNRGSNRDQFTNRGFGRRDRPSRWKSDDRHDNRHYNRNNNNNNNINNDFNNQRPDRDMKIDDIVTEGPNEGNNYLKQMNDNNWDKNDNSNVVETTTLDETNNMNNSPSIKPEFIAENNDVIHNSDNFDNNNNNENNYSNNAINEHMSENVESLVTNESINVNNT